MFCCFLNVLFSYHGHNMLSLRKLRLNWKVSVSSKMVFPSFLGWCLFFLIGGELLYNTVVFAIHSHESATGVHASPVLNRAPPPPSASHPSELSQCIGFAPLHASNLDWSSVSHMVIYMFQCYSLKSSHPRLLLQSPKVCFLHVSFAVLHIGLSLPSF